MVLTATIKEDKETIEKNKATIKEMGARIEVCVRARGHSRDRVCVCARLAVTSRIPFYCRG